MLEHSIGELKKKLVIAGPFPEPTGGVSVHISRLCSSISKDYEIIKIDESPVIKTNLYNVRRFRFFEYLKIIKSADIVHVHSSVPLFRFFHCIVSTTFRKPLIVSLHSFRKQNFFNSLLNFFSLRLASKVIAVNSKIAQDCGVRCVVIPAFIKPAADDFKLTDEMNTVLARIKSSGKKIAVSNAYKLDMYNGKEIYGFDQIIEAFSDNQLKNEWCVVLVVSTVSGCEETFDNYKKIILESRLDNVFLFDRTINFCGLLAEADLFIRATLSDGDALSVREALLLNVKTIASDCSNRPVGTILYKTADVESLKSVIKSSEIPVFSESYSFENQIISLYEGLL